MYNLIIFKFKFIEKCNLFETLIKYFEKNNNIEINFNYWMYIYCLNNHCLLPHVRFKIIFYSFSIDSLRKLIVSFNLFLSFFNYSFSSIIYLKKAIFAEYLWDKRSIWFFIIFNLSWYFPFGIFINSFEKFSIS